MALPTQAVTLRSLTVALNTGGSKMAQNGKLRLELVDVYGKRLQENVDISLRNLQTSDSPSFKKQDTSKFIISIQGSFIQ